MAVVHLRLPMFGFGRRDGRTLLYPPFGMLTVAHPSGVPLDYEDLRRGRPTEPVGTFPHAAVRGPAGDYARDQRRLLALYDPLCDTLRDGAPFTEEREFAALLARVVELGLLPHYRGLGAEFYERFLGPGPSAG